MLEPVKTLLDELESWYWTDNQRRSIARRARPGWLLGIAEARGFAEETRRLQEKSRRSVAIWGPSQSGKSTFLSYFLDDPHSGTSAIGWAKGRKVSFTGINAPDDAEVLNPHNGISDASGCVTRFTKRASVRFEDHPIEIEFAAPAEVMLALAAGYAVECKVKRERDLPREFDEKAILGSLPEADPKAPAQRANLEFLFDLLYALERLIAVKDPRFRRLFPVWRNEVRPRILNSRLQSDPLEAVKAFAYDLLWDGRPEMTELFEGMVALREEMRAKHKVTGPIYTDVTLAKHLLNIQAFQTLMQGEPAARASLQDMLRSVRLRVAKDHAVLGPGVDGDDIFRDDPIRFGLLQGIIWHLDVPLKAATLESHAPEAAQFLDQYDVIDIPGASNKDQGADDSLLDFEVGVQRADILARVLKRGKTICILDRISSYGAVDHLLVLAKVDRHLPKAKQLSEGIRRIVMPEDSRVGEGRLDRIPFSLCLTFMSLEVNKRTAASAQHYPFSSTSDLLAPLGELTGPEVCTLYMTTYPHLPQGGFIADRTALERVRAQIASDAWYQERFTTDANRGTLDAMLFDPDGGVSYLLRRIMEDRRLLDTKDILEKRRLNLSERITVLTAQVEPPSHDEKVEEPDIGAMVETLVEGINVACETRSVEDIMAALRDCLSFRAEQMDPPPREDNSVSAIRDYVAAQVEAWTHREEAFECLGGLGLTGREPAQIMEALAATIPVEEVAEWWLERRIALDSMAMAEKARSHFSICLTNHVLGGDDFQNDQVATAAAVDMLEYAEARINAWRTASSSKPAGPGYDMIVAPVVRLLLRVARRPYAPEIVDEPGDDRLREVLARFRQAVEESER